MLCCQRGHFLFPALLAYSVLFACLYQNQLVRRLYKPDVLERKRDHRRPRWSPPEGSMALEMNPNCTMKEELVGIYHDPFSSSVLVVIEADTSSSWSSSSNMSRLPCLRPYLMGRLSGPALGMVMPWSYQYFDGISVDDNDTNSSKTRVVVEGQYRVPSAGVYFLEVIVILCNTWEDEAWRHANSTEIATQQCIEDAHHHRLTASNVNINVIYPYPRWISNTGSSMANSPLNSRTRSSRSNRHTRRDVKMLKTGDELENHLSGLELPGYWMRRHVNDSVAPLFTRFQPKSCLKSKSEVCRSATNRERFDPYHFVWNDLVVSPSTLNSTNETQTHVSNSTHFEQFLKKGILEQQRPDDTVCLFGASHSRVLRGSFSQLVSIPVVWVPTQFAWQLAELDGNSTEIVHQVRLHAKETSCTIVLVGLGQWDASHKESRPTPVDVYEVQMVRTLANVQLAYPSASVYLYNVHDHVLDHYLWETCPADDWRNPPLIDQYNTALQRIVKQQVWNTTAPLQFLDTRLILRPIWDSPPDWSHLEKTVSDLEALFIAALVFKILPSST